MDKQAEIMQAVRSAVTDYLRTTRGAHAFGSGGHVVDRRTKLIVHADDGEAIEVMVMVY